MTHTSTESDSLLLFSGLALRDALTQDILPAFEATTGIGVRCTFEPTSVLVDLIRSGEVPDVVLGVTASVDELAREEVLLAGSVKAIATSGIGIAVVEDRVVAPFSTAEAFVDFLLAARSVAYSRSGASGIYFAALLARLGIADEINTRATVFDSGFTATAVRDGRADVAIQQLSELASVPGVQVIDGFPSALQHSTDFSAAIATGSSKGWQAASLIDALVSDSSSLAFEKIGLTAASSR